MVYDFKGTDSDGMEQTKNDRQTTTRYKLDNLLHIQKLGIS